MRSRNFSWLTGRMQLPYLRSPYNCYNVRRGCTDLVLVASWLCATTSRDWLHPNSIWPAWGGVQISDKHFIMNRLESQPTVLTRLVTHPRYPINGLTRNVMMQGVMNHVFCSFLRPWKTFWRAIVFSTNHPGSAWQETLRGRRSLAHQSANVEHNLSMWKLAE